MLKKYSSFLKCLCTAFIFFSGIAVSQNLIVQTFTYTGATQTFVVPSGCINTMSITLGGGNGGYTNGGWSPGYGGRMVVAFTPTPGQLLYLNVGGNGTGKLGGYNGGGNGGDGISSSGGGGGGATDIRIGGNTLTNRIVVAGGGGGCGGSGPSGALGGDGGGTSGNICGTICKGGAGGFGGPSGGDGGCPGGIATGYGTGGGGGGFTSGGSIAGSGIGSFGGAGLLGQGGGGGDSLLSYGGNPGPSGTGGVNGGGGGGSGYYGGSGGMSGGYISSQFSNGGGGGGSSYADSTIFSYIFFVGYSFDGSISFTYAVNGPVVSAVSSSSSICSGGNLTLNANGVSSYTWFPAGSFPGSNSATVNVSPIANTNYTLMGTNALGCISQTVVPVMVTPGLPAVTIFTSPGNTVCAGETVILTAGNSINSVWVNSANTTTSTSNSIIVYPIVSTTYSVTGTNTAGCNSTTSAQIRVIQCTGTFQNDIDKNGITVSPNPGNGEFRLLSTIDTELFIINQLGETIKSIKISKGEQILNLTDFAHGLYFIKSLNPGHTLLKKIVIVR